jgi:hypothetical protein
MTGVNTEWKVVGREQDSGETEGERETECCCKRVMVRAINLTVRENIYDRCGRIIRDNQDAR